MRRNVEKRLAHTVNGNTAMFNVKRRLQLYVGKHPIFFYRIYPLKRQSETMAVTPATRLVIEGFPRSANTFAVNAFQQAQREHVRLAHHLHMPAQVIRAARWRIPSLVLIRNPEDAITSLVIRNPQSAEQALRHYIMFYETVAEYRDAFVLGLFEEVVGDYGRVIDCVNARFGTEFATFDHTEESVKKVFARIEDIDRTKYEGTIWESKIPRPSVARQGMKREVRYRSEDRKRERLIARAEAIYEHLTVRELEHKPSLLWAKCSGRVRGSWPTREKL